MTSVTASRAKYSEIPKALPVLRLQSVQWHTAWKRGPDERVMEMPPQAQVAVIVRL